ncbi:hypothetical protein AYI70_g10451 [Smittium culicis]|uniref:Uncharacterized protein n=1 Tax=Smittium culicis TaxID=133412 RepID=A0A1R1X6G8_9FUNG|nr:hypothetical protein AYI70_g10451 [Smittium culicis]
MFTAMFHWIGRFVPGWLNCPVFGICPIIISFFGGLLVSLLYFHVSFTLLSSSNSGFASVLGGVIIWIRPGCPFPSSISPSSISPLSPSPISPLSSPLLLFLSPLDSSSLPADFASDFSLLLAPSVGLTLSADPVVGCAITDTDADADDPAAVTAASVLPAAVFTTLIT